MALVSTIFGGLTGFISFLLAVFALDASIAEGVLTYILVGMCTCLICMLGRHLTVPRHEAVHSLT